ncbi:MAG: hypothetical protein LOD94_05685 [Gammaproteobacteria bacterium]|nr:hypothetical protein [Gammaproteobacteria bacterium]
MSGCVTLPAEPVMKGFLDWLLARPHRPILLAAATSVLVPVVTVAIVALETLRSGFRDTLPGAAIGAGVVAALLVISARVQGGDTLSALYAGIVVFAFAAGLGVGVLLRWARGIERAFRALVLVMAGGVFAVSLFGPGGGDLFAPLFDYIAEIGAPDATEEQRAAFRAAQPFVLGLLAAGMLSALVIALFLAYWLCGIAVGDTRFGREFRELRLGRSLGIPAMVLITAGLVLGAPLIQNLAALALVGFVFQGLSVMHAWAHARRWHTALVAGVYVLLITPLTGVVVLGLSAVGLMDNWFDLRAPLRPRT